MDFDGLNKCLAALVRADEASAYQRATKSRATEWYFFVVFFLVPPTSLSDDNSFGRAHVTIVHC